MSKDTIEVDTIIKYVKANGFEMPSTKVQHSVAFRINFDDETKERTIIYKRSATGEKVANKCVRN